MDEEISNSGNSHFASLVRPLSAQGARWERERSGILRRVVAASFCLIFLVGAVSLSHTVRSAGDSAILSISSARSWIATPLHLAASVVAAKEEAKRHIINGRTNIQKETKAISLLGSEGAASASLGGEGSADRPCGQSVSGCEEVDSCVDAAVNPCVDFYSYACGSWVKETEIPADKPLIARSFDGAADQVHQKLESIYTTSYPQDSPLRPLSDFYDSCMNVSLLNDLGADPLRPMLSRIDAASSPEDIGSILADFISEQVPSPIKLSVASAGGASKVMFVNGRGFVLPDASFYFLPHMQHEQVFSLPPDPHAAERRTLENYYYKLNLLAGYAHDEAKSAASTTIGLETVMAHWTVEEPQISQVVFDKLSSLEAVLPSVPWRAAFKRMLSNCTEHHADAAALKCAGAHKLLQDEEVVLLGSPRFLVRLELLLRTQQASLWARYLRTHYLYNYATLLDQRFLQANLEMDAAATGIGAEQARTTRCVKLTASSALSALSEHAFLARYFSKSSLEYAGAMRLLQLVKNAFVENLEAVPWMDAATKRVALEKAAQISLNIGGPDEAYLPLQAQHTPSHAFKPPFHVDKTALLQNVAESCKAKMCDMIQAIGSAISARADEWSMTATTVNAYYDNSKNAMFVPAGTLQPPFFALGRPMSLNFGGIGSIMGHEMTHGFDLNGRMLDAHGLANDWWSESAAAQFKQRAKCVDTVMNTVGAPRLYAQPQTLSEDLADAGGLKVALMAYKQWYASGHAEADVGHAEADVGHAEAEAAHLRRFFMAYAQNWCYKERAAERGVLARDVHAPGELRSNGPLSMTQDFADTFQCPAATPMNPAEKCGMWKDVTGEELLYTHRLAALKQVNRVSGATQTLASFLAPRQYSK